MILNSWDKEKETKGKISDDGCSSQLAIILLVIFLLIGIFTYLIILGASINKSDIEREIEDQEQIEYLRNLKKGGNK